MNTRNESEPATKRGRTKVERKSDLELVVTRTFDAPPAIVFEAFTKPELMKRWWVPKSLPMKLLSIEMDARTGGSYKLVFSHPSFPEPMAFFGRYTEVTPPSRIVWTNDEGDGGQSVTTVTFEEQGGKTLVVVTELHPSKEACDEAMVGSANPETTNETHEQLDALLAELTSKKSATAPS